MLQALLEELQDGLEKGDKPQTPWDVLKAARELLIQSPLFQAAVQQLSSRNVQGCIKYEPRAQQHRLDGNQLFKQGAWAAAAQEYTCALQYLDGGACPATAAKLHLNRGLAALQAAAAAAAPAAAAPAAAPAIPAARAATAAPPSPLSKAAVSGPAMSPPEAAGQGNSSCATCQRCRDSLTRAAAAAAVEDLSAALLLDPASAAKVYYRRATAHLLLGQGEAAAHDIAAGLAAAGAAGDGAGVQDFLQLQQRLAATTRPALEGVRDGQGISSSSVTADPECLQAPDVWPAQQQQEQQQQQEEEEEEQQQQVPHASAEPPAGPTLQQLQQLLAAAAVPTCTSPDTPTAPGNSNHGSLAIGGSSSDANTTGGRQGPTDNSDTTSGDRADAGPLLIPCWDPLQGRHLVAGRSCGPGQVLLQEVPLAVLPMKPVRGNRCWCCLGPLGSAPHPCPGCPLAVYCSWRCAQIDTQQQHVPGGPECGVPWTRLLPEPAVLATRVWAAQQRLCNLTPKGQQHDAAAGQAGTGHGTRVDGLVPHLLQSLAPGPPLRGPLVQGGCRTQDVCKPGGSTKVQQQKQQQQKQQQDSCQQQKQQQDDYQQQQQQQDNYQHQQQQQQDREEVIRQALQETLLVPGGRGWPDLLELVLLAVVTAEAYAASLHSSNTTSQGSQRHNAASSHSSAHKAQHEQQQQQKQHELLRQQQQEEEAEGKEGRGLSSQSAAVAGVGGASPSPGELLVLLSQLQANGIAVRPLLSSSTVDRLGLGLYPLTAAVVNHSCDPTCELRFQGSQLLLRTVKPVRAGQQLTISYGPQAGELATPVRQQQLLEAYGFGCSCAACGLAGGGGASGMTLQEAAAVGLRCSRLSCAGACAPTTPPALGVVSRSLGGTTHGTSTVTTATTTSSSSSSSKRHSGRGRNLPVGLWGVLPCSVCGVSPGESHLAAAMSALTQAAGQAQEGVEAAGRALEELQPALRCLDCTRQTPTACSPHMDTTTTTSSSSRIGSRGISIQLGEHRGRGTSHVLHQLQGAVICLQAACELLQCWLHPDNHLLGQAHHQLSGLHGWRAVVLGVEQVQQEAGSSCQQRQQVLWRLQASRVLLQWCQLFHPAGGSLGDAAAAVGGGGGGGGGMRGRGAPASKPPAAGGTAVGTAAVAAQQWQLPGVSPEEQLWELAGACKALVALTAREGVGEDGAPCPAAGKQQLLQQAAAVAAAVAQILDAAPMPAVVDVFGETEERQGNGLPAVVLELRAALRHSRSSGSVVLHSFPPHSTQLGVAVLEASVLGLLVAAAEVVVERGADV